MIRDNLLFLAIAVVQAAVLYWLHQYIDSHGVALSWMLPAYSLILGLPTSLFVLRDRLREKSTLIGLGTLFIWLLAVSLIAGRLLDAERYFGSDGLALYILSALLGWYVLTIFAGLSRLTIEEDASQLWPEAERLFSLCVFGVLFTLAFWGLILLGAALFSVIGLGFLKDFLGEPIVYYPLTATVFCFALISGGARYERSSGVLNQLLRVVGLLHWPVSILTLLFLASLLGTGMEPLWKTGHASLILVFWAIALLLFGNVALRGGAASQDRHVLLHISLLLLPVYPALALWSLNLRIDQYGFTDERLWGFYVIATILCASLVTALAALMALLRKASIHGLMNLSIAALIVAMLTLIWTTPLYPKKLAPYLQANLLLSGKIESSAFDYQYLRFKTGDYGKAQLQRIIAESSDANTRERAQAYLNLTQEEAHHILPEDVAPPVVTVINGEAIPDDLAAGLMRAKTNPQHWDGYHELPCLTQDEVCHAVSMDLNNDGRVEYVFVPSGVVITQNAEGQWLRAGRLQSIYTGERFATWDLEKLAPTLKTTHPRWLEVESGEQRWHLSEDTPSPL